MEAKVIKNRWGSEVRLLKTWVPNETGELAIRFATHFGLVAAQTVGEDKAGRAKFELQPVDMVVDRAIEMAEKLVAKMKEKNWIVDCPDLPEDEPEKKDNPPENPPEDTSGVGAPQGGS
jgi:hypothetical protein